jgi:Fur family peroxide stress response transcriptional regulator
MLVNTSHQDETIFRDICRDNGWRRTAQRRAVFGALCGNREHPSVDAIWRRVQQTLPDISLDSVYRILDAFVDVGLVRRIGGMSSARYDSDTMPHGHFHCRQCGDLLDFALGDLDSVVASGACIGETDEVEIIIRGRCCKCASSRNEP